MSRGTLRFEIETDAAERTTCDGSICRRKNAWMVKVHAPKFRRLIDSGQLSKARLHTGTAQHSFCTACGIDPFHGKRVTQDHVGINVFCLEGFEAHGTPVRQAVGAAMP